MTVWTLVRAWDDGVDDETAVFSSKEKVYAFLRDEIKWLASQQMKETPEIAYIFENARDKYLQDMEEIFSQDSNTFRIKWVFNYWLVRKVKIDEWA